MTALQFILELIRIMAWPTVGPLSAFFISRGGLVKVITRKEDEK